MLPLAYKFLNEICQEQKQHLTLTSDYSKGGTKYPHDCLNPTQ